MGKSVTIIEASILIKKENIIWLLQFSFTCTQDHGVALTTPNNNMPGRLSHTSIWIQTINNLFKGIQWNIVYCLKSKIWYTACLLHGHVMKWRLFEMNNNFNGAY